MAESVIDIAVDDLSDGKIVELLNTHHQEMHKYSPPESVHALDVGKLQDASITVWAARIDGQLAACGALKEIDELNGEIKSMKTDKRFLRKGIGAMILENIIQEAIARSYKNIFLETGSDKAFEPATVLYKKYGFEESEPFGDYKLDPYSVYMTKHLART